MQVTASRVRSILIIAGPPIVCRAGGGVRESPEIRYKQPRIAPGMDSSCAPALGRRNSARRGGPPRRADERWSRRGRSRWSSQKRASSGSGQGALWDSAVFWTFSDQRATFVALCRDLCATFCAELQVAFVEPCFAACMLCQARTSSTSFAGLVLECVHTAVESTTVHGTKFSTLKRLYS